MAPSSSPRSHSLHRNRLLAAISAADFALLQPHLRTVAMPLLTIMESPNRRIDKIYFMDAGVASVVAEEPDDSRVEVGLIGREGMSGTAVVLGCAQASYSTYIQIAGAAQQISARHLRHAMDTSKSLHAVLLKYVNVFMLQTSHTAIANARSTIDQRLARWILMAQDRTGTATLPLTNEFLALMLGVRRAGVTEALQDLKKKKLIDTGRSKIVVLNRSRIEQMAGNSYGAPEREYRRLIG